MKKYLGLFSLDLYDLGGIADDRVGEETKWVVQQYIRDIKQLANVDRSTIEMKLSGESIDEELDRYRTLKFSFVMHSLEEKLQLQRLLFRQLRDIDTGCGADVEIENYSA